MCATGSQSESLYHSSGRVQTKMPHKTDSVRKMDVREELKQVVESMESEGQAPNPPPSPPALPAGLVMVTPINMVPAHLNSRPGADIQKQVRDPEVVTESLELY